MKFVYEEFVGEELLCLFIKHSDMKNNYPIQVIDLRFQVYHITRKKLHLFEKFDKDPANFNARLFVILIRHRQNDVISDGNKIIEIKVI